MFGQDPPPPLEHVWKRISPHLSIKPCLAMTSFVNTLLNIKMTYTLGHLWAGPFPLEHVWARTPQPVYQTLFRQDVIWQRIVTIYSNDIRSRISHTCHQT